MIVKLNVVHTEFCQHPKTLGASAFDVLGRRRFVPSVKEARFRHCRSFVLLCKKFHQRRGEGALTIGVCLPGVLISSQRSVGWPNLSALDPIALESGIEAN